MRGERGAQQNEPRPGSQGDAGSGHPHDGGERSRTLGGGRRHQSLRLDLHRTHLPRPRGDPSNSRREGGSAGAGRDLHNGRLGAELARQCARRAVEAPTLEADHDVHRLAVLGGVTPAGQAKLLRLNVPKRLAGHGRQLHAACLSPGKRLVSNNDSRRSRAVGNLTGPHRRRGCLMSGSSRAAARKASTPDGSAVRRRCGEVVRPDPLGRLRSELTGGPRSGGRRS